MKPTILPIIALLLCFPGFVHAQYTFRQTQWGMTQAEVRNAENGEPDPQFSKGDNLAWRTKILDEHALVVYTFAFNKLVRAKYMLATLNPNVQDLFNLPQSCDDWPPEFRSPDKKHLPSCRDVTSNGKFILDFQRFEEALKKKYGTPTKEYKGAPREANLSGDSQEEGIAALDLIEKAIRFDKLVWYSQWKTKDINILLILHGSSGHLLYEIAYSDPNAKTEDSGL